ncbi:MAG TPA: hypothetical protein VG755_28150 [Nannocystaceae bacterium]|nr:hypothetical protein [Nannocystaceae bacterium]
MHDPIVKVVLIGVTLGLGAAWLRFADLSGLDDDALAQRLLESRGIICTPKIVDRDEGELHIVCADGKHTFVQAMPCGSASPLLCDILDIDAVCWEQAD